MYEERRKFPVFKEKNLEKILGRLGLLQPMQNNELRCRFCDIVISKQNFGAIFLDEETVRVSCFKHGCLEQISEVIQ